MPNVKIKKEKILDIQPSTIETIDATFFEHISENFNIFCTTNKGWKKTPVIWVGSERAYQIKHNKELRDASGYLILPMITVERTSVSKNLANRGVFWGNIKPINDYRKGSITIGRRIQQDKTANFVNARTARRHGPDGKVGHGQVNFRTRKKKNAVVYETITVPMPTYIEIMYSVVLRSQYQQQMNEMVTPFITEPGGINYFPMRKNGHLYEGFIQQDFAQENNLSSMDINERSYQTKVDIKVLGYLMGEGDNSDTPKVVIRENPVEIVIQRERVIFNDPITHTDKIDKYRS